MAGRRQHFIPRFLLRRFADERAQVRVISRERAPFTASIENIGHERDFFGAPGPDTGDESITREEARILAALGRVDASLGEPQPIDAALLFAHFSFRSRALRRFMIDIGRASVDLLHGLATADFVASSARATLRHDPETIRKMALDGIEERLGDAAFRRLQTSPQWPALVRMLDQRISEGAIQVDFEGIASAMRGALLATRSTVEAVAERVHGQVASTDPTPAARRDAFGEFRFSKLDVESDLVLGDSMVWGCTAKASAVPLHAVDLQEFLAVFLPLGRRSVLVGHRGPGATADAPALNTGAALASHEFLIGHPSNDLVDQLSDCIGRGTDAAVAEGLESVRTSIRTTLLGHE